MPDTMFRMSPFATLIFALALGVRGHTSVRRSHPYFSAPHDLIRRIAASPHASALPTHSAYHAPPVRARARSDSALECSPADHGGDPTGVADSTAALRTCVQVCVNQSIASPNGVFPGTYSFGNGKVVRDAGGCFINLGGGEYRLSAPVHIPEYVANMQLGYGSLVASPDFKPADEDDPAFLLVIGIQGSCKVPQGSCNIDINFPDLFIDGARVASGIQINNVMGVTIGPGSYFLNFTEYGLQINQGHEVMMERCWLGETNFDFDHAAMGAPPNATAIQINGNDHFIMNTIIFSSKVGVEVNGAADYIHGVHVWFPLNQALAFKDIGAMAFHVTNGGNRFDGCYIDGGRAVFEGTGLSDNIWTNGFECCAAVKGVNHGIILAGDQIGPGLTIAKNEFGGGAIYHEPAPSTVAASKKDCSAKTFPFNISGVQCQGLSEAADGNASPDDCRKACCSRQAEGSCSLWQWCDPSKGEGCGCWISEQPVPCGAVRSGGPWVGESEGAPPSVQAGVTGVRIENNEFKGTGPRVGSRATGIVELDGKGGQTMGSISFCDSLVFKQIEIVRSLTVSGSTADNQSPLVVWALPIGSNASKDNCTLDVVVQNLAGPGRVVASVDSSKQDASFV